MKSPNGLDTPDMFLTGNNRAHSTKCTAATEWNVHKVNHLWLEESYAKWKVMSITKPEYNHFPRRTNLMEVVGQTRIDQETIARFYEIDDDRDESPKLKKPANNAANGNSKGRISTVQTGMSTPVPAKWRNSQSTYDEESSAPPSTGRKAKERASAKLHDTIMPDVALYQKEMKRKGGIMKGKDRTGSMGSPMQKTNKRSISEESEEAKAVKKKKPKSTIFLLITAYTSWLDKPDKEDAEKV